MCMPVCLDTYLSAGALRGEKRKSKSLQEREFELLNVGARIQTLVSASALNLGATPTGP